MRLIVSLLTAVLASSAASAELPKSTEDDLFNFTRWGHTDVYSSIAMELDRLDTALQAALKKNDPETAATALAPAYGLTPAAMRELVTLWLVDATFPRESEPKDERAAVAAELRMRALRLAEETGYAALTVQAAAIIVSHRGDCDAANFDALVAHAPDVAATGWAAASAANCLGWYRRAAERAPQTAVAAAIALLNKDDVAFVDKLALYRFLSSEAALAHIASGEREAARAYFTEEFIASLWLAGAAREGLAVLEALPPTVRRIIDAGAAMPKRLHVDGFSVGLECQTYDLYMPLDLSLALFAVGRIDEAKAAAPPTKDGAKPGLLDHLFHRTDADPYDMVEPKQSEIGTGFATSRNGIVADAYCVLFSAEDNADVCEEERAGVIGTLRGNNGQAADAIAAALKGIALPGYADIRADAKHLIDDAIRRYGGISREEDQPPPRFAAQNLPPELLSPATEPVPAEDRPAVELPEGFAPLGPIYTLLRCEIAGDEVVAISAADQIAPSGYFSKGGLFVHISHDGGRHWDKPLFTGLVDLYPYEVAATSKMKMIAGDRLNLEVAFREIDPEYMIPPVPFEVYRRLEPGYYLTLPLADLARDSDGDGLTDIEEAFLLLDPANADSDGDGLADGVDPLPNVKAGPGDPDTREARLLIMRKLFGEAHIGQAPLPRSGDIGPHLVAIRPSMLADIGLGEMTLMYFAANFSAFARQFPVFESMNVRIVFNRAHDRAFMVWNGGGNGGSTLLLWKENGTWKSKTINAWIS